MTALDIQIELYVGRSVDFMQEVVLRDIGDGNGPFISEWNIKDKPQPTLEELTVFDEEATRIEQIRSIQMNRAVAYQPIEDQLDMIFWDLEKDTEKWREHIRKAKQTYPKPN